jgi:Phosphotransferase system cellobiose-specific component IIC
LNTVLYKTSGYENLNELFAASLGYAFKSMGTNLLSGLLFLLCSGLLWFLGIHGGNALELVSMNIFVPANTDPNVIMSKTFLDVFGLMGGCGATICMLIALLLFSKKKNHRSLAKVAIPTVLLM